MKTSYTPAHVAGATPDPFMMTVKETLEGFSVPSLI